LPLEDQELLPLRSARRGAALWSLQRSSSAPTSSPSLPRLLRATHGADLGLCARRRSLGCQPHRKVFRGRAPAGPAAPAIRADRGGLLGDCHGRPFDAASLGCAARLQRGAAIVGRRVRSAALAGQDDEQARHGRGLVSGLLRASFLDLCFFVASSSAATSAFGARGRPLEWRRGCSYLAGAR